MPFLELTAESDSLAEPGTKVILSEDLSSVTDYDTLLDAYMAQARDPLPHWLLLDESSRVLTELGGESFTIKSTLDRAKLGPMGAGLTEDPPFIWRTNLVDRAAGKIATKVFAIWGRPAAESEDKPLVVIHSFIHKSPLVMEFYAEFTDPNGEPQRAANQMVLGMVMTTMEPIVLFLKEETIVKVRKGASRKDPSKACALSDPLDAHTSLSSAMDVFFKYANELMKGLHDVTVITDTPEEFKCTCTNKGHPVREGQTVTITDTLDREARELQFLHQTGDEQLFKVSVTFHEDPLQMEAVAEVKGERVLCECFLRDMSIDINRVIRGKPFHRS